MEEGSEQPDLDKIMESESEIKETIKETSTEEVIAHTEEEEILDTQLETKKPSRYSTT